MTPKRRDSANEEFTKAHAALDAGNPREAEKKLSRLLKKLPGNGDILNLLGLAQQQQGQLRKARRSFSLAHKAAPQNAGFLVNLGLSCRAEGAMEEAEAAYREALAIEPALTMASINLGTLLSMTGRTNEALKVYEAALETAPRVLELCCNYGNALSETGKAEKAEAVFLELLERESHHVGALLGLAGLFKKEKRLDEAEQTLRRALAIAPSSTGVLNNLGTLLSEQGKLSEAESRFKETLALVPSDLMTSLNLGSLLKDQGRIEETLVLYEEVLKDHPASVEAITNYLLSLNYSPKRSPEEIFEAHKRYGKKLGKGRSSKLPTDGEKIRIGYISPDFRRHSVANFIAPVIEGHDRKTFEIFCYSDVSSADDVTDWFIGLDVNWREASNWSGAELAKSIRDDGIHILVDLTGYTAHNRLAAFAERSAPMQITWIGYPNTTGIPAMDYRLVDEATDPTPQADGLAVENLVRVPGCFLCYRPVIELPDIAPPPFVERGQITFGSFNNMAKISDEVLVAWAEVLAAVPGSHLLLKGRPFADEAVWARVMSVFVDKGIDAKRLDLRPYAESQENHLAVYGDVDIALDTFPYNGTTTTCEALAMGVPVVSFEGDRHAARVGKSLLENAGLGQLVAATKRDYVGKAVALASDRDQLTSLRKTLRQQLKQSRLMDEVAFMQSYEQILKALWDQRKNA